MYLYLDANSHTTLNSLQGQKDSDIGLASKPIQDNNFS